MEALGLAGMPVEIVASRSPYFPASSGDQVGSEA